MRFYLASSFLFPRSFRMRLFAVCFVATHVPLLAYAGWGAATAQLALPEFLLLLAATVVGMAIALLGIGAMLAPLHVAQGALAALEQGGTVARLPDGSEDVIGSLLGSVNRAATAAESRMRALDLAAKEDMLTGVRNRRGFVTDVEDLLPAERHGTIALLDLDRFKAINDRFGHDEGDRVLRDFASRLSSELRRGDLVARWGGEEFAVLFRGATEEDAGRVLARVSQRLIAAPILVLDGQALTFSAGICRFHGESLDEAIGCADKALYEAKDTGRNRIVRADRAGQPALPLG
ncbi:GGDEF domain-containing protein [Sphingomonas psychrotolerans]|uniref:diguanylate cyclase n=1 Tax=Sphingomonas psychrotolerans TaxID=1327635 RepID=A0ABU3N9D2_9SPHN|nr:GGDEF domain-containing protein [Sphingomonas psychrotolerans]MDT8760479.1 GGDEF domain-containing protein [Sphingomonas psychrotolerans]